MTHKQLSDELRARLGWVTMPLNGKKPIIDEWQKLSTSEHIRTSWNHAENIGLVTGAVSGVIVLDIDNKDNGVEDWNRYIATHGEPQTTKVQTGGGGLHYYFKYNERVSHLKSASKVAVDTDGRKMAWDIKSNGGQVVMPPSIHPDTKRLYEYVYSDQIIEMPDWILEVVSRKPQKRKQAKAITPLMQDNTPAGFNGFECVGIQPDPPRTTTTTTATVTPVSAPTECGGTLSREALAELVTLINVDRADIYDDWRNVIWAIKSVSTDHNDLAHVFSQRCEAKYDAAAVDKVWNEGDTTKENTIGVGSLLFWLREDIGDKEYFSFKQRHGMVTGGRTLTLNVCKPNPYNVYEPYYLDDFLRWASQQIFDINQPGSIIIGEQLKKVVRCISYGEKLIYFKENSKRPFVCSKKPLKHLYPDLRYRQAVKDEKAEDGVRYETPHVFEPTVGNMNFYDREVDWIPYHADQPITSHPGVFNLFPGFQARKVDKFTPDHYKMIEPLLSHIYVVWANCNFEYYQYLLSWLAYPLRTLKRTEKALFLIGKQGIGKTMIFDFMSQYVYGDNLTSSIVGLDLITQRFNSISSGKMMIVVNEMDSADNNKNNRPQFERFKSLITDRVAEVERKGFDSEKILNFTNYCGCSNNDYSVIVEDGDRRFPIFQCSEVFKGNTSYFDDLVQKCFNQDVANAFYTYLRLESSFPLVDLNKIPETEIRKQAIEMSQPRTVDFSNTFFGTGEATFSANILHEVRDDDHHFITVDDLYYQYKEWFKVHYPNGKVRNSGHFSQDLKSNCSHLEHAGRRTIPGKGQRSGYFIQPSAYQTCQIEVSVNGLTGDLSHYNNGGLAKKKT
ncbi:MAG TPA: bifunctional DNA primase/polymerase [Candidatus Dojkabacteria bacterium]|nr:bifunctional DNA primase/polymerase [Candidatus Dojkabacteria bacterium]